MNAQPQRRLVRLVRHVPHRRAVDTERKATAPLADAVRRLDVRDDLAPSPRRQSFFCQDILQNMLVQAQVRDELLQFAVLVLELLDPPQLADAQPAIHLLPAVECLLLHAHPADDLRHRRARLCLLQRKRNLLFRVPRLLHVLAPCAQASKGRKLSLSSDGKNREDVISCPQ